MMFADLALATEIDGAEARLCAALAEGVARRDPASRTLVRPLAGGLAIYCGAGSPANKAVGVGLGRHLDLAELASVEEAWRDRREAMRVELSSLSDASVGRALTERGYRLIGFENVLGRPVAEDDRAAAAAGIDIEQLAADGFSEWIEIAVEGFAHPDAGPAPVDEFPRDVLQSIYEVMVRIDGFRRYVARVEGVNAGVASLRVDGRIAQLCGAATLPPFRRRGIQTSLLARRLADARESGCALATVTTQPGTRSQANAEGRGFQVLYTRAVLVREWEKE